MSQVLLEARRLLEAGETLVLATVVAQAGSTPRMPGSRMLVREGGRIFGTIGGGLVEATVMQRAAELLAGGDGLLLSFELTSATKESLDMICGGSMRVLLERLTPELETLAYYRELAQILDRDQGVYLLAHLERLGGDKVRVSRAFQTTTGARWGGLPLAAERWGELLALQGGGPLPSALDFDGGMYLVEPLLSGGEVYLFGAGHVSLEVAKLAVMVDFAVVVVDDREEFANPRRFPMARQVVVLGSFDQALADLNPGPDSYLVIITRGHSHDKTVLAQALNTPARYIGMIGSLRKRDKIYADLKAEGVSPAALARVYSPIGLAIGAETPAEIAVSIVAELIQARAGLAGGPRGWDARKP
ncbi:MAG: XdhC family protein [Deltaproteobacteria bacterium]|nr:XdhC family protein [Deltaproteobacteria bacterium]MCB2186311.1 XdhC family protein [Deltaproteobacteria bacterium]